MAPRLELQSLLNNLLEDASVYYQPPPNAQITYPCVVYHKDGIVPDWADNYAYKLDNRYLLTVIDRDPDSEIPDKLAKLPYCIHERFYVADNLNHHVFRLFF